MENELISCQKKNEELTRIVAEMEKTQQRLIDENSAILSVKVVNEVEIQTDQEATVATTDDNKGLATISKKDDRQKVEEGSRYATSLGVRTVDKLIIRIIIAIWMTQQRINFQLKLSITCPFLIQQCISYRSSKVSEFVVRGFSSRIECNY